MASRNFYRCMAWAMAAAIAGCQSSGDNSPPPSSTDRSPFSSALTYNRNNNPSEMGLTLVNGSQNKSASSSSSVSSLPPPCPGVPAAPPGNVYPPPAPPYGFAGANAVPGGPVPGQSAQSPSGYWLYQPANGYGVTKVVPDIRTAKQSAAGCRAADGCRSRAAKSSPSRRLSRKCRARLSAGGAELLRQSRHPMPAGAASAIPRTAGGLSAELRQSWLYLPAAGRRCASVRSWWRCRRSAAS